MNIKRLSKMKQSKSPKGFPALDAQAITFWSVMLIVLTTLVTSAAIFHYGELFFDLGEMAKRRLIENPTLAFVVTPISFWVAAYLCRKFSRTSAGNTISHIESTLTDLAKMADDSKKIGKAFSFRSVLVSAASSLLATFGGGALGREAPSVYMSAGIFAIAAQKFKKVSPKINFETWICAGTAAGFAIAFHAPIAGFIYVVEKLFKLKSRNFFDDIFWTTIALFAAIIILHKVDPMFAVYDLHLWFGGELVVIALIAIVCGVSAFLFKQMSTFCYEKVTKIESNFWHLAPVIVGILVSIISIYGGVHSFSGGIKTAREALAGADLSYLEVLARIANTILTFASGCAGGLVAPAVAIGAGIGYIFSNLMENIDAKVFILSGMTAFLSPILGTPFAAAMVILETSSQPILAFPFLFFSSAISFFSGKFFIKFKK